MTIGFALIVFAAAALLLFVWRTIGRTRARFGHADLSQQVRAVDLEAFRNLTDPAEERYLREHLPAANFREIQRKRLRAAIEYVVGVYHNAGILLSVGQAARQNPDPLIAEAARNLVDEALRLRLSSVHSIARLWVRFVFPDAVFQPSAIVDRYQRITEGAVRLGRLQNPDRGGLLSRAL
jgi:hypothetical protein